MTLRQAIVLARTVGGWVVYDQHPNKWSEYTVQHYWSKSDEEPYTVPTLHWTAGLTVGGEVALDWENDPRIKKSLNMEGFEVYARWKDSKPIPRDQ